jgi:hypothetical protein
VGQALRGDRLPHAQRQLVVGAQALEQLERPQPPVLVVDRGDAARRRDAQPAAAGVQQLGDGRGRVAVAEAPGRVLAQHAGGLPGGVAFDHPSGRVQVAAGVRQRGRVHPHRVVVLRREDHGPVGGDLVERRARWRVGPVGVAPAQATHPGARRDRGQAVGHAGHRVGARARALEPDLPLPQRPGRKVDVRVVEAGQDAGAAEVDPAGVGRRRGRHPTACDSQPLDHRRGGVERANRAVLEEEVGLHPTDASRARLRADSRAA